MKDKVTVNYNHEAFRFASEVQFKNEWQFAHKMLDNKEPGEKMSRGSAYFDDNHYKQKTKHSYIRIDQEIYALASNKPKNHIGKGGYGKVQYAMGEDCTLYAMKVQKMKHFSIYGSLETSINWDLGILSSIPSGRVKQKAEKIVSKLYTPLLYQGNSLRAHLKSAPITTEEALRLFIEIAIEIYSLHTAMANKSCLKYAHNDLKTDNILLRGDRIVLVDFGFASTLKKDKNTTIPFRGTRIYLPFGGKYQKHEFTPEAKKITHKNMELLGPEGIDVFALKRIGYVPVELFDDLSSYRAATKGVCLLTPNTYQKLPKRLQEIFYTADSADKALDVSVQKDHSALFLAALMIAYQKNPTVDIETIEQALMSSIDKQTTLVKQYIKDKGMPDQTKSLSVVNPLNRLIASGNMNELKSNPEQYKSDLNKMDSEGRTPLLTAVLRKDIELIKTLCQMGADPNLPDEFGYTPLVYANHEAAISTLVACGADVNKRDPEGKTPLLLAIEWKKPLIDSLVAIKNIDLNQADYLGRTPVFLAAAFNNLEVLGALYAAGAHLNLPTLLGHTPVFIAVNDNHLSALKFLIEHNVPANQRDYSGESLLFLATRLGRLEMIDYLMMKTKGKYSEDLRTVKALRELVLVKGEKIINRMEEFIEEKLRLGDNEKEISITPPEFALIIGNKEIADKFKEGTYSYHRKTCLFSADYFENFSIFSSVRKNKKNAKEDVKDISEGWETLSNEEEKEQSEPSDEWGTVSNSA